MAQYPLLADGDILNESELWKKIDTENTVTLITGSSAIAETEIGEIAIPANKVSHGILILAHVRTLVGTDGSSSGTGFTSGIVRLRVGTNASGPSNTLVDTFTFRMGQHADNTNNQASDAEMMTECTVSAFYTGATWSSANYAHVTGEITKTVNGGGTAEVECVKMQVFAF